MVSTIMKLRYIPNTIILSCVSTAILYMVQNITNTRDTSKHNDSVGIK